MDGIEYQHLRLGAYVALGNRTVMSPIGRFCSRGGNIYQKHVDSGLLSLVLEVIDIRSTDTLRRIRKDA